MDWCWSEPPHTSRSYCSQSKACPGNQNDQFFSFTLNSALFSQSKQIHHFIGKKKISPSSLNQLLLLSNWQTSCCSALPRAPAVFLVLLQDGISVMVLMMGLMITEAIMTWNGGNIQSGCRWFSAPLHHEGPHTGVTQRCCLHSPQASASYFILVLHTGSQCSHSLNEKTSSNCIVLMLMKHPGETESYFVQTRNVWFG